MKQFSSYQLLVTVVLLLFSCGKQQNTNEQLMSQVKHLAEQYPDSALALLDSVNTTMLDDAAKADYVLTKLHIRDIAELDLKYDHEIFAARDYFTSRNDQEKSAWACLYAAKVLWAQGKNGEAAKELLVAEAWAAETTNFPMQGLILYNMGVLYFKQYQHQEAADNFKSSYPYFETGHGKFWNRHKVRSLELTALSYMFLSVPDSTFSYYKKAFANAVLYNDTVGQVDNYINTALAFCDVDNFEAAKDLCWQAMAIINRSDSVSLAKIYIRLADVHQSMGRKDSAYLYLNQAHELLQDSKDSKDVAWLYLALSEAEEVNGHYEDALQYHKQYAEHFARVYAEIAEKSVLDIHKRYRNEQLQQELKKQKQYKTFWITGLSALIIFIALVTGMLIMRAKNRAMEREADFQVQMDLYRKLNAKVKEAEKKETYNTNQEEMIGQLHRAFDMMAEMMLVEELAKPKTQKAQGQVKKILQKIDQDSFISFVNNYQQKFAGNLVRCYPALTKQEQYICCLYHFGFSSKAIALILDLALSTVWQRRSDIRKKMAIDKGSGIEDFLNSMEND